jgi:diacylglycerol kinase family enzyme
VRDTGAPGRISVIINEKSRTAGRADAGGEIQALFAKAGAQVRLERISNPGDLAARARQAAARGDLLVAAGGDGTVGAVAAVAVETRSTFAVLPMGTLNHFAKDLGIPSGLPEAVAVITAGHVHDLDVGEMNGRIFVNNSSVGIYPRMVWERNAEQQRGRGKWTAFAIAMARTWRRYRTTIARLSIDGRQVVARTPFIFVGNNAYHVEGFEIGARAALDRGRLSVFIAPECGRFEILTLPVRALRKRLTQDPKFASFEASEVSIELSRHRVSVAFDGEVALMRPPLRYRIRQRVLRTIVPEVARANAETTAGSDVQTRRQPPEAAVEAGAAPR